MIFCGMNVNLQRSHAYTDPYDALSDLSISVTTRSGTVMNNGDVFNLPAQEVNLKQVDLAFTVTQDGTLKAGDKSGYRLNSQTTQMRHTMPTSVRAWMKRYRAWEV